MWMYIRWPVEGEIILSWPLDRSYDISRGNHLIQDGGGYVFGSACAGNFGFFGSWRRGIWRRGCHSTCLRPRDWNFRNMCLLRLLCQEKGWGLAHLVEKMSWGRSELHGVNIDEWKWLGSYSGSLDGLDIIVTNKYPNIPRSFVG